jgi:hypothetical protein
MILLSLLLGLIATVLYAAALVVVAWRLGARKGTHRLPVAWLGGGGIYWVLSVAAFLGGMLLVIALVAVRDIATVFQRFGF